MNYTKGEWKITGTCVFVNGDYRQMVAQAFDPNDHLHTTPIAEANAHLIAAALENYQNLKDLWQTIKFHHLADGGRVFSMYAERIEKGFAKAEGRS